MSRMKKKKQEIRSKNRMQIGAYIVGQESNFQSTT